MSDVTITEFLLARIAEDELSTGGTYCVADAVVCDALSVTTSR